jgi:hypothetical protein
MAPPRVTVIVPAYNAGAIRAFSEENSVCGSLGLRAVVLMLRFALKLLLRTGELHDRLVFRTGTRG